MKPYLPIIAILFMLASCDQVIFPEPQPQKLKPLEEIPDFLQGSYLDEDGDTLYIQAHSFAYQSDEYQSMNKVYLSDSSVLKKYYNHYFYSTPLVLDEGKFWVSYILHIKDDDSGFDLYAMDPGDIVKLAKLQEISSKIRDIEEEDQDYYLFNPKKKHYKKIISDTIFTKMISFRKIFK